MISFYGELCQCSCDLDAGKLELVFEKREVGSVVGFDRREHLRVNLATGFGGDPRDLSVRVFLIPQLDGLLVSGGPPPKGQRNLRVRGAAARTAAGCGTAWLPIIASS